MNKKRIIAVIIYILGITTLMYYYSTLNNAPLILFKTSTIKTNVTMPTFPDKYNIQGVLDSPQVLK